MWRQKPRSNRPKRSAGTLHRGSRMKCNGCFSTAAAAAWVVKRLSVSVNMNLLSLHKGDVHGNHHHGHMPSHCMEQGQAHRPEISAEAERDLGNPDSVAARMSNARTGVIQPGDRQQITRLRFGQSSRSRCNTGYACDFARDRYAEEDATAGQVP